jgi:hypothetical protein
LQQAVADGVAEGVVDELELIEVEEHDRNRAAVAPRVRLRDADAVAEEQPVRQ